MFNAEHWEGRDWQTTVLECNRNQWQLDRQPSREDDVVIMKDEASETKNKMKIVVIGGSGLIGSKVVNILRQGGHEVAAASPSTGVNTLTGEGLAEALAG